MRRGIGLRRKSIAVGLFEAGSSVIPLPSLTSPVAAWSVHEDDIANVWQNSGTPNTNPATSDGDVIGAVEQLAGFGAVDASQTTTAAKPLLKTGANGINNHNAALFDGSDDFWAITGVTATSGAKTLYYVVKPDGVAATRQYLLDIQTGRLIIGHLTDTTGKVGFFDTSWKSIADATTGAQILSFLLVSPTATLYRDGASLGNGAYTDRAIGGTVRIGADHVTGNYYAGLIGAIYIYNAEHSTTERESMEAHLASKWGITLA